MAPSSLAEQIHIFISVCWKPSVQRFNLISARKTHALKWRRVKWPKWPLVGANEQAQRGALSFLKHIMATFRRHSTVLEWRKCRENYFVKLHLFKQLWLQANVKYRPYQLSLFKAPQQWTLDARKPLGWNKNNIFPCVGHGKISSLDFMSSSSSWTFASRVYTFIFFERPNPSLRYPKEDLQPITYDMNFTA